MNSKWAKARKIIINIPGGIGCKQAIKMLYSAS
jgi:hypothetical protein